MHLLDFFEFNCSFRMEDSIFVKSSYGTVNSGFIFGFIFMALTVECFGF
jgi:hypothetical protein